MKTIKLQSSQKMVAKTFCNRIFFSKILIQNFKLIKQVVSILTIKHIPWKLIKHYTSKYTHAYAMKDLKTMVHLVCKVNLIKLIKNFCQNSRRTIFAKKMNNNKLYYFFVRNQTFERFTGGCDIFAAYTEKSIKLIHLLLIN